MRSVIVETCDQRDDHEGLIAHLNHAMLVIGHQAYAPVTKVAVPLIQP